jgi:hypothetical protein
MDKAIEPPLGPPPRKASLRRGIRNARRGYRTLFALVIIVFAGWAALDMIRWNDLPNGPGGSEDLRSHTLTLAIGHGLVALITLFVLRFIERPLRRELRLARRGDVATGQVLEIRGPRRKRGLPSIRYSFRTAGGATFETSCVLPRRIRVSELAVGMPLEVLYDPRFVGRSKPRLAFDHVEFGEHSRKKPASA